MKVTERCFPNASSETWQDNIPERFLQQFRDVWNNSDPKSGWMHVLGDHDWSAAGAHVHSVTFRATVRVTTLGCCSCIVFPTCQSGHDQSVLLEGSRGLLFLSCWDHDALIHDSLQCLVPAILQHDVLSFVRLDSGVENTSLSRPQMLAAGDLNRAHLDGCGERIANRPTSVEQHDRTLGIRFSGCSRQAREKFDEQVGAAKPSPISRVQVAQLDLRS
jgi:hypothetical protein